MLMFKALCLLCITMILCIVVAKSQMQNGISGETVEERKNQCVK